MQSTPRETTAETIARVLTVSTMPAKTLIRSDVCSIYAGRSIRMPNGREHRVHYHVSRFWYSDGSRMYMAGDQNLPQSVIDQIWEN